MQTNNSKLYFQNYMPNNVCFGCGKNTKEGLHIKSYWNGICSECLWTPREVHQGWSNIMNGGIIATLIDCHCMGTSMAYAYKSEGRGLESLPEYRYATGTIKVKYIAPTPNKKIKLIAKIESYSEKKIFLKCNLISDNTITVQAEVLAFRVYDSSKVDNNEFAP
jgi:hypothetical protein|tara:strand:- start:1647 stop:2138 length:492 start_codon:yes stop_codon:yes gene_type:complete